MLLENQEENIKWFLQKVENKPQGAIPEKSNIHISPHGIEGMIPPTQLQFSFILLLLRFLSFEEASPPPLCWKCSIPSEGGGGDHYAVWVCMLEVHNQFYDTS